MHKIFKLCGSPPEEFWKKTKLPHAAMFKPQHAYESSLSEKCKEFAPTALSLLESFLAIEPYKRGTASSALMSEVALAPSYSTSQIPKCSVTVYNNHDNLAFEKNNIVIRQACPRSLWVGYS